MTIDYENIAIGDEVMSKWGIAGDSNTINVWYEVIGIRREGGQFNEAYIRADGGNIWTIWTIDDAKNRISEKYRSYTNDLDLSYFPCNLWVFVRDGISGHNVRPLYRRVSAKKLVIPGHNRSVPGGGFEFL